MNKEIKEYNLIAINSYIKQINTMRKNKDVKLGELTITEVLNSDILIEKAINYYEKKKNYCRVYRMYHYNLYKDDNIEKLKEERKKNSKDYRDRMKDDEEYKEKERLRKQYSRLKSNIK